jgi:hypothetical protein
MKWCVFLPPQNSECYYEWQEVTEHNIVLGSTNIVYTLRSNKSQTFIKHSNWAAHTHDPKQTRRQKKPVFPHKIRKVA